MAVTLRRPRFPYRIVVPLLVALSGLTVTMLAWMSEQQLSRISRQRLFESTARSNLERNEVRSVTVELGDAMTLSEEATYDVIAVTGSLPVYDPRFERALAEGGRLFVTVGGAPVMDARKVTRTGRAEWTVESLFETRIDPLVNAPRPPAFVF